MSLKFKVIDERTTTTVVGVTEFRFYSAENRTLTAQIVYEYDGQPYYIASGGTITVTLDASPTNLTKSATISSTDRSIISVTLSQADTTTMVGGAMLGDITEGANKRVVRSVGVIKKLSKGD